MKAYTNDVKDVIINLETNSHEGLTYEEVKKRVEKYGKNKLKEKKEKTTLEIFLRQFTEPLSSSKHPFIFSWIGSILWRSIASGEEAIRVTSGEVAVTLNFIPYQYCNSVVDLVKSSTTESIEIGITPLTKDISEYLILSTSFRPR